MHRLRSIASHLVTAGGGAPLPTASSTGGDGALGNTIQSPIQAAPRSKVLVANRSEIAIRIFRAARELGYGTVAVFAPDDASSLHVAAADEAIQLRGEPGPAAYLDGTAILDAARRAGAIAIHPGYGFLSEDGAFAAQCEQQGILFVGPRAETIELFGDKTRARALAVATGLPVSPGVDVGVENVAALRSAMASAALDYPVMLKSVRGGGGRGIRVVESADQLDEAFLRCASEAQGAFGDASIFVERYVPNAKHIEVQVVADAHGDVVHLFERDCSVQLRNQKVVELAPAYGLAPALRDRLTSSALSLARAAGYCNAGTVEFLVEAPGDDNALSNAQAPFYFLEVNPRIQVEHTITEQVTGVDIVAAQLQIAMEKRTLRDLGLHQDSLLARGFAIQARVCLAAPAATVVSDYSEPAGAGVRVDGALYLGYKPSPLYDPLLAKVICSGGRHVTAGAEVGKSRAAADIEALGTVVRKTQRALDEFHVGGLATNVPMLQRILSDACFQGGAATTRWLELLLAAEPAFERLPSTLVRGSMAPLLRQGVADAAAAVGLSAMPPKVAGNAGAPSDQLAAHCPDGGVLAPLAGTVVQVDVAPGQRVHQGDQLLVLSAMKMESPVLAPSSGTVRSLHVTEQAVVQLGELLLLVDTAGEEGSRRGDSTAVGSEVDDSSHGIWAPEVEELAVRRQLIAQMGGPERVERHRAGGKLTCRERVEAISDAGTWREIGGLTGRFRYDPNTGKLVGLDAPANVVTGVARLDGRPCALSADDFTVRGGSAEGAIADKRGHIERMARDMRIPVIRLLDGNSGGGSVGLYASGKGPSGGTGSSQVAFDASQGGTYMPMYPGYEHQLRILNEVPVVSLLLGTVVGIGAARAVGAHFSVILRAKAQLMVAGPPVVLHATREDLTKEQLGGAAVCAAAGSVDNVAESEADAFAQARMFLSFLPSSVWTLAPRAGTDDPPDRAEEALLSIVPRDRRRFFDSRKAVRLIVDVGSFFEIGASWARNMVVGFARLHGYSVGVVTSDSRFQGGALDVPASMKLRRHLDLCELFHIPLLNLVDMPGFLVGGEAERTAVIRHGMTVTTALYSSQLPRFTCVMRRAFGVAGQAMVSSESGSAIGVSTRVAWPSADWGSLPLEGGIEAAYGRQLRAQPDGGEAMKAQLLEYMEKIRSPFRTADFFGVEDIIDPRETRRLACQWAALAYEKLSHGDQLGPRPGFFRP